MRHHLNTIYVTSEQAWLRKDGATVVIEVDGAERGRAVVDGVAAASANTDNFNYRACGDVVYEFEHFPSPLIL